LIVVGTRNQELLQHPEEKQARRRFLIGCSFDCFFLVGFARYLDPWKEVPFLSSTFLAVSYGIDRFQSRVELLVQLQKSKFRPLRQSLETRSNTYIIGLKSCGAMVKHGPLFDLRPLFEQTIKIWEI
jgi:hypothetical protein